MDVEVNGRLRRVHIRKVADGFVVALDDREWVVDGVLIGGRTLSLLLDSTRSGAASGASGPLRPGGASHEVLVLPERQPGGLVVRVGSRSIAVRLNGRGHSGRKEERGAQAGPQRIVAPMPGKIARVLVSPGDAVRARQPIVVVEAMKMENELRASRDGRVAGVMVTDGQPVEAGTMLAVITDE